VWNQAPADAGNTVEGRCFGAAPCMMPDFFARSLTDHEDWGIHAANRKEIARITWQRGAGCRHPDIAN